MREAISLSILRESAGRGYNGLRPAVAGEPNTAYPSKNTPVDTTLPTDLYHAPCYSIHVKVC